MLKYDPIIQKISIALSNCRVDVLRLDQLHPDVSGNKWFKLKYNLLMAKEQGHSAILTFGGAFSNHIAATAAACKLSGMRAIGIIRGEETGELNPTLLKARKDGMQLHFVDRDTYRQKQEDRWKEGLLHHFGPHYLIPEGGNNGEGLKGCMEILAPGLDHDYVLCACGTAATFAGILASAKPSQTIIGISVLKGENKLPGDAARLLGSAFTGFNRSIHGNDELEKNEIENSCISNSYCFNGYARYDQRLADFKANFEKQYKIPLDHVYTAKLFYALSDLVEKRKFRAGSRILVVHSGGLQGNVGFGARFKDQLK